MSNLLHYHPESQQLRTALVNKPNLKKAVFLQDQILGKLDAGEFGEGISYEDFKRYHAAKELGEDQISLAALAYPGFTQVHAKAVSCRTQRPKGVRRPITKFSAKSRLRMIKTLLAIKPENYPQAWSTVTFPDEAFQAAQDSGHAKGPGDIEGITEYANEVWNRFITRLRITFPGLKYIARKEYERRKSGDFKGYFMLHFHVMWLLPPRFARDEADVLAKVSQIQHIWADVAGGASEKALQVALHPKSYAALTASPKRAIHYMSKYCAKPDDNGVIEVVDPETGEVRPAELGRHWFCSRDLPVEPPETIQLSQADFFQLRRLLRRKLRSICRLKGWKLSKSKLYQRMRSQEISGFALFLPLEDVLRFVRGLKPKEKVYV